MEVARLDLTVKYEQSVKGVKELKAELRKTGTAGVNSVKKIQGSFDKLKASVFQTKRALRGLTTGISFKEALRETAKLNRSLNLASAAAKSTRATRQLRTELRKTSDTGLAAGRKLKGSFDRLRNSIFSARSALTALAAGFVFRAAINTIAEFGRTMSAVAAVTKATGNQFKSLSDEARRLGGTTMFSASQAADGMRFLAMAGFDVESTIKGIEPSLRLAQAGALDLGTAADIASNILTSFGIDVGNLSRVGDILAQTSTNSNTSIQQLGEAMRYAGPIAASLGHNLAEVTAAVGVLGDSGIQASMAGTGLRQTFLGLVNPTSAARKVIKELNLDIADLNPITNSLNDIIKEFARVNIEAGQAARIFGARAVNAVLTLVNNIPRFEELIGLNRNINDVLKEMAAIMEDNLYGSLKNLSSAVEAFVLQLGEDGLTGGLRGVVDTLADMVRALGGSLDTTKEGAAASYRLANAVKFLGITFGALILGKVTASLLTFVSGTITATAALRTMTAAQVGLNLALLANPLTAVVTVLGAVGAALYIHSNDVSKAKELQDQHNKVILAAAEAMDKYRWAVSQMNPELEELSVQEAKVAKFQLNNLIEANKGRLVALRDQALGFLNDAIEESKNSLFNHEMAADFDERTGKIIPRRGKEEEVAKIQTYTGVLRGLRNKFEKDEVEIVNLINILASMVEKVPARMGSVYQDLATNLAENTKPSVDALTESTKEAVEQILLLDKAIARDPSLRTDSTLSREEAQKAVGVKAFNVLTEGGIEFAQRGQAAADSVRLAFQDGFKIIETGTVAGLTRAEKQLMSFEDEVVRVRENLVQHQFEPEFLKIFDEAVEVIKDSFRNTEAELQAALGSLLNEAGDTALRAILPVSELANTYGDLAEKVQGAFKAQQDLALFDLQTNIRNLGVEIESLVEGMILSEEASKRLKDLSGTLGIDQTLAESSENARILAEELLNASRGMEGLTPEGRKLYQALLQAVIQTARLDSSMENFGKETKKTKEETSDFAKQLERAGDIAKELARTLRSMPDILFSIANRADGILDSLRDQSAQLDYQVNLGVAAEPARLRVERDKAINEAAREFGPDASIDELARIGATFDSRISEADRLAANIRSSQDILGERGADSEELRLGEGFHVLSEELSSYTELLDENRISQNDWLRVQGSFMAALDDGTISALDHRNAFSILTDAESLYAKRKAELTDELNRGRISQAAYNELLKRSHPLYQASLDVIDDLSSAENRYAEGQAFLNSLLSSRLITMEQYNAALRKLRVETSKSAAAAEELSEGIADAFTSALGDMINGSKSFGDALKDLGRAVQDLVLELLVLEPLRASLSNFLGGSSFIGSLFGGGGFSGGVNYFPPAPAGGLGVGLYHEGGIVGERATQRIQTRGFSQLTEMLKDTLRPNEEISILKKGEEVLTDSDPRHIYNIIGENDNRETSNFPTQDLQSYHEGGVVGENVVSLDNRRLGTTTSQGEVNQRVVVNVIGAEPNTEVEERTGSDGTRIVDVIINRTKSSTAVDIARGGSDLNRAIETRYGLNPARGNRQ